MGLWHAQLAFESENFSEWSFSNEAELNVAEGHFNTLVGDAS